MEEVTSAPGGVSPLATTDKNSRIESPTTRPALKAKSKKCKDKTAASQSGAEDATKKRPRVLWTKSDLQILLSGLYKFGKDFDKIRTKIQSKNKDQCRYFYYRMLRKIDKTLTTVECAPKLDSPLIELTAIISYLELTARGKYTSEAKRKSQRFGYCLAELISSGVTTVRKDGRNASVKLKPIALRGFAEDVVPLAVPNGPSAAALNAGRGDGDFAGILLAASEEHGSGARGGLASGATSQSQSSTALSQVQQSGMGCVQDAVGVLGVTDGSGKAVNSNAPQRSPKRRQRKQTASAPKSNGNNGLDFGLVLGQGENGLLTPQQLQVIQLLLQKQGLCVQPIAANKLSLHLEPKNPLISCVLENAVHNPRIVLTFKSTKSLSSIIEYLLKKWVRVDTATGKEVQVASGIRLYPPGPAGNDHFGWGVDNAVGHSAFDIFQRLGCPKKFQLDYAFNIDAAAVAAYITPLLGPDFNIQHFAPHVAAVHSAPEVPPAAAPLLHAALQSGGDASVGIHMPASHRHVSPRTARSPGNRTANIVNNDNSDINSNNISMINNKNNNNNKNDGNDVGIHNTVDGGRLMTDSVVSPAVRQRRNSSPRQPIASHDSFGGGVSLDGLGPLPAMEGESASAVSSNDDPFTAIGGQPSNALSLGFVNNPLVTMETGSLDGGIGQHIAFGRSQDYGGDVHLNIGNGQQHESNGARLGVDHADGLGLHGGDAGVLTGSAPQTDFDMEYGAWTHSDMNDGLGLGGHIDHFSVFESMRNPSLNFNKENIDPVPTVAVAKMPPPPTPQQQQRFVFDAVVDVSCDGFGSSYFARNGADLSTASPAKLISRGTPSAFSSALNGNSGSGQFTQPNPVAKRPRDDNSYEDSQQRTKRALSVR